MTTAEQYAERIHSAENNELWHILRAAVRDMQVGAEEYVDLAEMVFERRAELRKEIEDGGQDKKSGKSFSVAAP